MTLMLEIKLKQKNMWNEFDTNKKKIRTKLKLKINVLKKAFLPI